jgi:ankyrin repeat protein
VNFRNNNGETALIKVLDGPYNEDTFLKLKYLISVGVRLNVRGKSSKSENTSSLGVAICNSKAVFQSGNTAEVQIAQHILELLIDAGVDVSSLEVNGRSLLHLAAETNNLFAAQLLLESGAKVIPIDDNHKTPLDIAGSGEMIKLLKKYQVKELS